MSSKERYQWPVPEHQADATLSQANPISGTKYTVLDTTKNVRILSIAVVCTWTVQPSPLEVHLTMDGEVYVCGKIDPASAADLYVYINPPNAGFILDAVATPHGRTRAFLVECRSLKVEVEITGGTVSNLTARVKWARW